MPRGTKRIGEVRRNGKPIKGVFYACNLRLCWVCFATLGHWFQKWTRATLSANEKFNQNQPCVCSTRFPALGACYLYVLRVLIGSWVSCVYCDWLG